MSVTRTITLPVEDIRLLWHAASTTVQVYDAAEQSEGGIPEHAPLYGKRGRLLELARRLDHEANCEQVGGNDRG